MFPFVDIGANYAENRQINIGKSAKNCGKSAKNCGKSEKNSGISVKNRKSRNIVENMKE
jgi:hypothetical protein